MVQQHWHLRLTHIVTRLVAVVDKFMYVHALETMELLRTIDIAQNLQVSVQHASPSKQPDS